MERVYSLAEIQTYYPDHEVLPHELGFLLLPNNEYDGHQALLIPGSIPMHSYDDPTPIDLTQPIDDRTTYNLLHILNVNDCDGLYCLQCRFGNHWYDGHRSMHIFQICNPRQATHLQIIAVKDRSYQGWMPTSSPNEQQLNHLCETHHTADIASANVTVHSWVLLTDFRTEELRESYAKDLTYQYNLLRSSTSPSPQPRPQQRRTSPTKRSSSRVIDLR